MFDNTFPSLVASLFYWRCLAVSTSSFLHVAMNLRSLPVAVLTQASAFKHHHRFPIPCHVKRPDVAQYAIGPLFFLPTPSSPHCTLKVFEHDSLWQSPAAHSDERPRSQKFSRSQCRLNALTPGYLKGAVVRRHPMV